VRCRDTKDGFTFATGQVLVLSARIDTPKAFPDGTGWSAPTKVGNWRITLSEVSAVESEGRWLVDSKGGIPLKARLRLALPVGSTAIAGSMRLEGRRAGFVTSEGHTVHPRARLSLNEFANLRAFSPRPERLVMTSKGFSEVIETIGFEAELRLAPLAATIARSMMISQVEHPIDAVVELDFHTDQGRGIRISRFDQILEAEPVEEGLVLSCPGLQNGLFLARRPLVEPWAEYRVEVERNENDDALVLVRPTDAWVGQQLLYLRDDRFVRSRPTRPLSGSSQPFDQDIEGSFAWAVGQSSAVTSRKALRAWHDGNLNDQSPDYIRRVARGLNGLTPVALNVLLEAPLASLARALVDASDDERIAVWDLQNELPFSWVLFPIDLWADAVNRYCRTLFDALESVTELDSAMAMAQDQARSRVERLATLDPFLGSVLRRTMPQVYGEFAASAQEDDVVQHLARRMIDVVDAETTPAGRFENLPIDLSVHLHRFSPEIGEIIKIAAGWACMSAGKLEAPLSFYQRLLVHKARRSFGPAFDEAALSFLFRIL
jgi:hypothetical protein